MSIANFLNMGNVHEQKIFEHFGGRVQYGGEAPFFDKPLVVLLFTNRCGSNLFADYLVGTGRIARLTEATNFSHVIETAEVLNIDNYPDFFASEAISATSGSDRVYGIKASAGQMAMLLRWNIPAMFSRTVIYRVVRQNIVAQAVSMSIANQTGKWTSNMEAEGEVVTPEYSYSDIQRWVNRFTLENGAANLLSAMMDAPSKTVIYEEFRANPLPAIRAAIELLGQDASDITVSEPSISKQADDLNREFRRRFLAQANTTLLAGGPHTGII